MEPGKITWVDATLGALPKFAVLAGIDAGLPLYVIRAEHLGGLIPGKLVLEHSHVYIPYGGQELPKAKYQVLTAPPGSLSWVEARCDDIPENAVVGGHDPNNHEPYYIGRVEMKGTVTVGKVQRSYELCYIPYGGEEHEFPVCEILVKNAYGRAIDA